MVARQHPSIIIADNNEFYRHVLGDFYRDMGYDVRVAVDGLEALEMIQERKPDLLLLDLIMPRFDGARLCSYVKEREEYRELPIIILSGILADEIEGPELIKADAYVAKMPLEQISVTLREVSSALLAGRLHDVPIHSGFEKMFRREVVLELLQERKTALETLDSLSEGIVELSTQRRLVSCNLAFQEITGLSPGELLARPVEDLFPASRPILMSLFEEVDRGAAMAPAVLSHGERELQIKVHRFSTRLPVRGKPETEGEPPEGTGVHHAIQKAAATTAKVQLRTMIESIGYTLMVEDITQRTRAEREREHLRARLAQSEKMSAIGLFVSGAAHELNNPLTSVLGYSQLLMQKCEGTDLRKDLEKIAAGADRCKTIVENLMAFARASRPDKAPIDFGALLREALGAFQERMRQAAIRVTLDLQPDLPTTLADPEQIHQAFFAVLDNACKALADHPGERSLRLASRVERGRIQIEFSDSGPGIPEQVLSRVFEPFFTTRQVGQGAGLGLSVAYGMVTAHAGRIKATNQPGGGATVLMEFPILGRESVVENARASTPSPVLEDPGRRTILIVDDEEIVLDLLVDILDGDLYRIDTAGNGRDGLRKIEGGSYDLVILDLRMPDMTGQQMYEELTRVQPGVISRVMFITADTVTPDVETFLRRVRRPCLTKPFAIDAVLESVRRMLASSPAA